MAIGPADFEGMNGYPNTFWGWGGEDDELRLRADASGLTVVQPLVTCADLADLENVGLAEKHELLTQDGVSMKCRVKWELLDEHRGSWRANGLSGLAYEVETQVSGEGCA